MSVKTKFRGPGELEKTGYIPEGSSDERDLEAAWQEFTESDECQITSDVWYAFRAGFLAGREE